MSLKLISQKDYKSGQRFQIGARETTNRGRISNQVRDYKSVQNNIYIFVLTFSL